MAAEQRKLLEQLMGAEALVGGGGGGGGSGGGRGSKKSSMLHVTDPKICRSFLCGICPHDLFVNTKQDLGPCPRIHSDALRGDFQRENAKKRFGFEFDYEKDLSRYVEDCQKRIDAAYRRLDKTVDEVNRTEELLQAMSELDKSVAAAMEEIETLGELGFVVRAIEEYAKLSILRHERNSREEELKVIADSGSASQQKLQVCEVCGAYLSKLDNDRRLADHFGGKMHMGYARMRDELKRVRAENRTRPRPAREREDHERDGGRHDRWHRR